MIAAPWYVVLKAQQCSDCKADALEMAVDLCAEHVDEPADFDEERAVLVDLAREHGLAAACRALFNLNEFTFVD